MCNIEVQSMETLSDGHRVSVGAQARLTPGIGVELLVIEYQTFSTIHMIHIVDHTFWWKVENANRGSRG